MQKVDSAGVTSVFEKQSCSQTFKKNVLSQEIVKSRHGMASKSIYKRDVSCN